MDDKRGVFVGKADFDKMPTAEQARIAQCPQLSINEVVVIKGVKFRVVEMRSRGRLALKMLTAGA